MHLISDSLVVQAGSQGSWTPGKTTDVGRRRGDEALENCSLAPAAILESVPDAVVAPSRDGRIVFVNALAEELFGYARDELLGQPVQTLWPERVRERYTRNMELYFATEHPLRFSTDGVGSAARRLGVHRRDELGDRDDDRPGRSCSRSAATSPSGARPRRACAPWRRWASARSRAPIQSTSPTRRSI